MAVPLCLHRFLNGAVPVATTVNVAICPAVTVWLAGCVVIEGATGGPGFVAETYPHPALTIPIAKGNTHKTAPRRFMITSLFQNVFPGTRLLGSREGN